MDRALPIVFCLLGLAYGIGQLWAAWFKPSLQQYWIFTPRWQHGYRASRFGVTAQASVVISMVLVSASGLLGIDHRYAFALFLLSGATSFVAWAIDVGNDSNAKR